MTQKTQQRIIFIITLLIAFGVWLWFYPLNTGSIVLNTNVPEYEVTTRQKNVVCYKNPCRFKHRTGLWSFFIQKDGYAPATKTLTIERGKEVAINAELVKIVKLVPSNVIPKRPGSDIRKPLSPSLNISTKVNPTWNPSGNRLAYLDKTDNRLKIQSGQNIQPVTVIKNIDDKLSVKWSPTERHLALFNENNIYLIGIREGSRLKVEPDFTITQLKWGPKDAYLLASDSENNLYQISPETGQITAKNTPLNLNRSAWIEGGLLIYSTKDESANQLTINTYDPAEDVSEKLLNKLNFDVTEVVYDTDNETAYFYNPNEEAWYKMEF